MLAQSLRPGSVGAGTPGEVWWVLTLFGLVYVHASDLPGVRIWDFVTTEQGFIRYPKKKAEALL